MAKKLGNDYRLWIEGSTPGTYAEIKGGTTLKISRQAGQIDTSTKDDFPYGSQAPGLRTLTIDGEIYPNLAKPSPARRTRRRRCRRSASRSTSCARAR